MDNFSEKSLISVEDLIRTPSLKKSSSSEESKTSTSIPQTDASSRNQLNDISESETHPNEVDQTTTIQSQTAQNKQTQTQQVSQVANLDELRNLPQGGIYQEGYILRQQKGIISSWEERYIILTSGKLFFFENDKKNHLMGCIYIKYLPVQIIENQQTFELSASDGGETIVMKGKTKEEHSLWLKKLHDVISFCKNEQKVSIRKFNLSIYEQKDFTLEQEFISQSQTGDLLLVSSDNSVSYLQKFITHSQFNHVAMIVRFKDQLKIFQANQDDGVFIYDWKQYIQTFKDHKRFAWRKLVYPNKHKYDDKLKELIKKYIGRSYSIASSRMLRRKSDDKDEEEDREFFCSEIIAKVYKTLGLLDREISSVRYWPISFTSRGELNLMDGAYFSLEKNILLSKHLKL